MEVYMSCSANLKHVYVTQTTHLYNRKKLSQSFSDMAKDAIAVTK